MERLLGPLERKVMAALWNLGSGSVRDVLETFPATKRPAYTTLMTVMGRLYEKGLLSRERRGHAYLYRPIFTREGFIREASRKAVREVLERFGDVAVTHFLEEARLSPEQLERLRRLEAAEGGQEGLE